MISDDRASHWSHLIRATLTEKKYVEFSSEAQALKVIKAGVRAFIKRHEDVHQKAVSMIKSQSKEIFEGSSDWDILYRKYFDAEMKRQGLEDK